MLLKVQIRPIFLMRVFFRDLRLQIIYQRQVITRCLCFINYYSPSLMFFIWQINTLFVLFCSVPVSPGGPLPIIMLIKLKMCPIEMTQKKNSEGERVREEKEGRIGSKEGKR